MPLTSLTAAELFEEIADLAREQGVADQETWDGMVEEIIEDHLALGEIDLDEDVEGIRKTLRLKWATYKDEESVEAVGGIKEEGEVEEETL